MKLETHQFKLKNGIRVLAVPLRDTESVMSMVWVKTGSRNESEKEWGISHVLEHMLFKGTESYPTPLSLATEVDSMGAEYNAFTDKEFTAYYIKSASMYFEKSLGILSEMVLKPRLGKEELEREKGVIIQEIKMYEDQPRERAMEEFENLIFSGNKLGRLIIGSEESVRATTSEVLRAYLNRWYRGENFLVVLVGKVNPKKAKEVVERYFSSAKSGKLDSFVEKGRHGKKRKFILEKKTEQTHFVVGFPGLDVNDKWRYVESVLRVALGGNMSSRLFTEIREKRGLAYYVGCVARHFYDVGYLGARAGVRKDKFNEALKVMEDQLFSFSNTLSGKEVDKAKKYLLGKLTLSLESSSNIAQWMGARVVLGLLPENLEDIKEKIKEVTVDDVKKLSAKLLISEELRLTVVR